MSKQTTETDVAFISALAELLNKNDLTELSVKREYGEDDSLEVRVVQVQGAVELEPAPAVPGPFDRGRGAAQKSDQIMEGADFSTLPDDPRAELEALTRPDARTQADHKSRLARLITAAESIRLPRTTGSSVPSGARVSARSMVAAAAGVCPEPSCPRANSSRVGARIGLLSP